MQVTQCDQCGEISKSVHTDKWYEITALRVGFENTAIRRTMQLCSKECVAEYLGYN